MEFWWDVKAMFKGFVIVDPDSIFSSIGPQCEFWDSDEDVFYWNCVFWDTLEEFHPDLEVLPMPRHETLQAPFIPPFYQMDQ